MPNINRIRVNNVKYNFGTQCYDDFTMRLYGKNTLYDLANGGGKSVLMLLLLQNLIPNCTLDEKQPIEKLFRAGGGNTVIHSLVEWKLDEATEEDGYRYMTTGFCARKAKDVTEDSNENKDTASIEYFNYCILYRNYNDNDIINLPLSKSDEKISFSGLKNYLKEIGRKDLSLEVKVFERKGEYQRFISGHGLYESQWEIIRGINKTEGHVRTYFETNYKTTRKVVEDLLIEEIIEKAFYVKTERDSSSDNMAKTLLDIKDKLVELANKKRDLEDYDRQIELVNVLQARVTHFLDLYEERDRVSNVLGDIYVTGEKFTSENAAKLEELNNKKEAKLLDKTEQKRRLESLKIKKDTYTLEEQLKDINKNKALLEDNSREIEAVKLELSLKESINDYIAYLNDLKQVEENEAIIRAELNKGDDQSRRMRQMASLKKLRDDEKREAINKELVEATSTYEEAKKELDISVSLEKETEIALEIARSHEKKAKDSLEELMGDISRLRSNTNILVLSDVEDVVKENEALQETLKEKNSQLEKDIKEGNSNKLELSYSCRELERQKEAVKVQIEDVAEKLEEYRENATRLSQMLKIYGVSKKEQLIGAINERYTAYVVENAAKEEELKDLYKKLKALSEHQLVGVNGAVNSVKDYIETRHGMEVILGIDYISAIPENNKIEVLRKYPLLPYGIIVEDYKPLTLDNNLRNIDTGDVAVTIYNKNIIEMPMGSSGSRDDVIYVCRNEEHFTSAEFVDAELDKCSKKIEELEGRIRRLNDTGNIYKEDMEYVAKLTDEAFLTAEENMVELKGRLSSVSKELELKTTENNSISGKLAKDYAELEGNTKHLYELIGDRQRLEELRQLSIRVSLFEDSIREYSIESNRLTAILDEAKDSVSKWKVTYSENESKVTALKVMLSNIETEWETIYKDYYNEETIISQVPMNMADSQLEAEFKALVGVSNSITVVLEDKRKLIDTLKVSMARSLKSIEKRTVEINTLEELKRQNKLYGIEEDVLSTLSHQFGTLTIKEAQLRNELSNRNNAYNKLSGSIEHSIKVLEERYGVYEDMDISFEEATSAISEGDKLIASIENEYKEIEKEYKDFLGDNEVMVELFKDVKRIIDTNEINLENAHILYDDKSKLRESFESSLMSYDKSRKALDRARAELLNYKTHTAETLNQMKAYELANSILNDIVIPNDYSEAKILLENLSEIVSYIGLEKNRIETGLRDMEYIKKNFEKQCIERCRDVKTELDKLPKLSRIMLDGEPIQMVGLTIPYVKEEFYEKRMSDYIDDVVTGADKYEDSEDRMKYIRGHLELKKLFSVIVADMNGIKLSLYKRERIKEQSRYLRYEEAVGSTGQSQGIYIQFLVSVINYIAGMYSPSGDTDKLRKVIFIDNPFGAAKDVYIWEPIFALLKINNVQLVVPARGATPAITSRFDVNYILGQQLVGGKQQTVVMDYRSQVEQEELEYRRLDYSQVSFDFM